MITPAQLIAELESGRWVKGSNRLKVSYNGGKTVEHCCLGVICEISPDVVEVNKIEYLSSIPGIREASSQFSFAHKESRPFHSLTTLAGDIKGDVVPWLTEMIEGRLITLNDHNESWEPVIVFLKAVMDITENGAVPDNVKLLSWSEGDFSGRAWAKVEVGKTPVDGAATSG